MISIKEHYRRRQYTIRNIPLLPFKSGGIKGYIFKGLLEVIKERIGKETICDPMGFSKNKYQIMISKKYKDAIENHINKATNIIIDEVDKVERLMKRNNLI